MGEEEGVVVGVRLVHEGGGAHERLMHWTEYGRDQCTYELNEEEIVQANVLTQTIQISMSDGVCKLATVKRKVCGDGSVYEVEWQAGFLEGHDGHPNFEFDLVEWTDCNIV